MAELKRIMCHKVVFMTVFLVGMFAFPICIYGQQSSYRVISATSDQPLSVKIHLVVYCKDKKAVTQEAQLSALRIVLFDGCPNTPFTKALLEEGLATSYQKYPSYFDNLYNYRYGDFISNVSLLSDFKKADKQKGTEFEIIVKVLQLRKDLEKNNIRKKMGI